MGHRQPPAHSQVLNPRTHMQCSTYHARTCIVCPSLAGTWLEQSRTSHQHWQKTQPPYFQSLGQFMTQSLRHTTIDALLVYNTHCLACRGALEQAYLHSQLAMPRCTQTRRDPAGATVAVTAALQPMHPNAAVASCLRTHAHNQLCLLHVCSPLTRHITCSASQSCCCGSD